MTTLLWVTSVLAAFSGGVYIGHVKLPQWLGDTDQGEDSSPQTPTVPPTSEPPQQPRVVVSDEASESAVVETEVVVSGEADQSEAVVSEPASLPSADQQSSDQTPDPGHTSPENTGSSLPTDTETADPGSSNRTR
jgi:hypothetical protein